MPFPLVIIPGQSEVGSLNRTMEGNQIRGEVVYCVSHWDYTKNG
jgi:hypothetical protein